jgi:predicted transcriptional regulator
MDAIRGDSNYQATSRMVLKLLRKGWIEKCECAGELKYRVTSAGYEALKAKVQI